MTFKPYPKWITTTAGIRMIVNSEAEESVQMAKPEKTEEAPAIPAGPVQEVPPVVENVLAQPTERAALLARAEELGIKVDNRWGDARIASEIAAAK
jgi:hypothetical protein